MNTALKATALACTLKPSSFDSSSDLIAGQVLDELGRHGVEGEAHAAHLDSLLADQQYPAV